MAFVCVKPSTVYDMVAVFASANVKVNVPACVTTSAGPAASLM
jgi:hypothetical protein